MGRYDEACTVAYLVIYNRMIPDLISRCITPYRNVCINSHDQIKEWFISFIDRTEISCSLTANVFRYASIWFIVTFLVASFFKELLKLLRKMAFVGRIVISLYG